MIMKPNFLQINSIEEIYKINTEVPSSVSADMEKLYEYACYCQHITEFGFGKGMSSSAFILAKPKTVVSYDIQDYLNIANHWRGLADAIGVEFIFHLKSSLEVEIEPTDLLFIDSLHTPKQLYKELQLHCDKVSQFIIMHDTRIYGERDEYFKKPGLQDAIDRWLKQHKAWEQIEKTETYAGLTIMERQK